MLGDFQNDEPLAGPNNIGHVARFHAKGQVFQFLGQHATLEVAEVAALRRGGPFGRFLGDFLEAGALVDGIQQPVSLLFGGG